MADADRLAAALRYQQELEEAQRPAFGNPMLMRQGSRRQGELSPITPEVTPAWYERALPMEGRATFLPFRDTAPGRALNKRELALPGLLAGALNAMTAPGRALSGSDPDFDPNAEAMNVAGMVMGGASSAVRPTGSLGMGGRIRGKSTGLPYDALMDINKLHGQATKLNRRQIAESFAPLKQNQHEYSIALQKLGQINSDIAALVKSRKEAQFIKPSGADPLITASYKRKMLADYGPKYTKSVNDAIKAGSTKDEAISASSAQHYDDVFMAPQRAKEKKTIAKYMDNEIAQHWTADRAEKIRSFAAFSYPDAEAASATLEALVRTARKSGWKTEHTSKSQGGKSSSRYLVSPDGSRTVRVSDHELPMTQQREYNQSKGLTGRWDDEIVTTDWRHQTMADYIKRLNGTD